MKKVALFVCLIISAAVPCLAKQIHTVNPANDGQVNGAWTSTSSYVIMSNSYQGILKFSTNEISSPIEEALLAVNPYGSMPKCFEVAVYAYQSSDSNIRLVDFNAGTFLGIFVLPGNLAPGQQAFFNVTEFMQSVTSPYVTFNLRSTNGKEDLFSSLEENQGKPSQLIISVPEPLTISLLCLGGMLLRKR